jgi:uncharacterized membrane protein required for colicin V production
MIPDWLSLIDVAFGVAVLLFAWGGYQKGFAAQVAYILTFLFLAGGLFFAYPSVYSFLHRIFQRIDEAVMMWLLLAGLVLLAFLVFTLLSKMLAHLLKAQISERADRVYGLLLGTLRGGLAALLVMIMLVMVGPQKIEANVGHKSYIGTFVVQKLVPRIRPHITHSAMEETAREWKNRLQNKQEAGTEMFD